MLIFCQSNKETRLTPVHKQYPLFIRNMCAGRLVAYSFCMMMHWYRHPSQSFVHPLLPPCASQESNLQPTDNKFVYLPLTPHPHNVATRQRREQNSFWSDERWAPYSRFLLCHHQPPPIGICMVMKPVNAWSRGLFFSINTTNVRLMRTYTTWHWGCNVRATDQLICPVKLRERGVPFKNVQCA